RRRPREMIAGISQSGRSSQDDTERKQDIVQAQQRRDDSLMSLADPTAPSRGVWLDVGRRGSQPPDLLFNPRLLAGTRIDPSMIERHRQLMEREGSRRVVAARNFRESTVLQLQYVTPSGPNEVPGFGADHSKIVGNMTVIDRHIVDPAVTMPAA